MFFTAADAEEVDVRALADEQAMLASSVGEGEKQPTARVVGIIRRKWRQYCGIIKKRDSMMDVRGDIASSFSIHALLRAIYNAIATIICIVTGLLELININLSWR